MKRDPYCGFITLELNVAIFSSLFLLETECRHANAKAQEAIDHLTSFQSSREEISHPGIETANIFLEIWVYSPPSSNKLGPSRTLPFQIPQKPHYLLYI